MNSGGGGREKVSGWMETRNCYRQGPSGEKWAVVSGGIKVKTWTVGTGRRHEALARGHEGAAGAQGR